jgi:class I fructose-bisphosphate aldolase
MPDSGKTLRLQRILGPDGHAVVMAFDHALQLGPTPGMDPPDQVLHTAIEAGIDAVLVTPGLLKRYAPVLAGRGGPGIIVRLDWSNMWRPREALGFPEGATQPIASVEWALALGADAVLTYSFLGLSDPEAELRNASITAQMVQAGDRLGVPILVEPMVSRRHPPQVVFRPDLVAMHVRMVTEMGVDLIKTDYTGDAASFSQVVQASLVPVLAAGGAATDEAQTERDARAILESGAAGIFFGRRLFQASHPKELITRIRRLFHPSGEAAAPVGSPAS